MSLNYHYKRPRSAHFLVLNGQFHRPNWHCKKMSLPSAANSSLSGRPEVPMSRRAAGCMLKCGVAGQSA